MKSNFTRLPIWMGLLVLFSLFSFFTWKGFYTGETATVFLTTKDGSKKLQQQSNVNFAPDDGSTSNMITVDESVTYQTMDGFGAAITGSSAYNINQKLTTTQKDALLADLFTNSGIRLSFVRHTMGASDFSLRSYTYNDLPSGQTDPSLTNFTIAEDLNDVIPVLKLALAKNNSLKIMGSPWSAPAWMKDNQSLHAGKLSPAWQPVYADYFVKYIKSYSAEGVPIYAVTVQNEPLHETTSYPSMGMTATQQADFLKNNLGPAFTTNSISSKIIIYDHNWDKPDYPNSVLNDPDAKQYAAGSAWHCYAGNEDNQSTVNAAHPDKGIWFTECSGGDWSTNFGNNLSWNISNLIIGTTRHWAKSVLLWNMALDLNHGPTNGGCSDCRGVVTIDQNTGAYTREVEYYVLGHASKFVDPGAVRIASNMPRNLENVAFKNPDGSKVLIVLNTARRGLKMKVKWGSQAFYYTLEAGAVATFKWNGTVSSARIAPKAEEFEGNVVVYPNVAVSSLNIKYEAEDADKINVNIVDLNGRVWSDKDTKVERGTNNIKMEISTLPKGEYILFIQSSGKIIKKKILIGR